MVELETKRLRIFPITPEQSRLWLEDLPALERQLGCPYRGEPLGEAELRAARRQMTDEEYALWKSKFPAFLSDFYEFRKQAGQTEEENFDGDAPVSSEKPQSPKRRRERKINSGR